MLTTLFYFTTIKMNSLTMLSMLFENNNAIKSLHEVWKKWYAKSEKNDTT